MTVFQNTKALVTIAKRAPFILLVFDEKRLRMTETNRRKA
jgi:hypothetical protein